MLTAQDFRDQAKKTPFVPFRIATSAGETFDVTHPDLIWIGRREVAVGIADKDDPSIFDRFARISILHVTTITDLPVPSQAHLQNGQA